MEENQPPATDEAPRAPVVGRADLVTRGRRLFEFLAAAQQLKLRPVRTTDSYERDGSVLWLGDLPDHAAIAAAHVALEPDADEPILTIERVPVHTAPSAPRRVTPWLIGDGSADDPARHPTLSDRIPNPTAEAEDGSDVELSVAEHPEVTVAYDRWMQDWETWAAQERRDRPVRALYTDLFSTYLKLSAHPEEIELVLGVGCLAWRPPRDHPAVRRHLLTSAAAITFDDRTGTITVTAEPTAENLTVEVDMLDPSFLHGPTHNEVRTQARDFAQHPLDRPGTSELARRLVHSFDADGEYRDDLERPDYASHPTATFAPALILRKRSQTGLVDIFRAIAAEIANSGSVPSGLVPLLDPDFVPPVERDSSDGAMVTVDDEVFLPLPLNEVQLQILRRVDRHAQTLVQGPPGTGKTHTAAALLTHLLAQGKRVLVTAHTDRALKEVRDKLPESIKPLAVAVVGTDRSDMADLKVAIEHISNRSATHDDDESHVAIDACTSRIDQLRRDRASLRSVLVEARQQEVVDHQHAGYTGTLAKIAQEYQAQSPPYEWLAELHAPEPADSCPIDNADASRWLRLLRDHDLVEDEVEARERLINLEDIPVPEAFAELVDAEAAATANAIPHAELRRHPAFEVVAALKGSDRDLLRSHMHNLARKASELEQRHESWMNGALHDIRSGRAATWTARANDIRALIGTARPVVRQLGATTEVVVEDSADSGALAALASNLHAYVTSAGSLKTSGNGSPRLGAFTNKVVKEARPLFETVRVDGQVPTTAKHLASVLAYLKGARQLSALDKAWPTNVHIPAEDTLRERLQWHETELDQLDKLLGLGDDLAAEERLLAAVGLPRPDWTDISSVLFYARLVDAAGLQDALAGASAPLVHLEITVASISRWADAAHTARTLDKAVRERDRDSYAAAYARAARLLYVRRLVADRDALTVRVRERAPTLVEQVLAAVSDPSWDEQIPNLSDAWNWASAGAWLLQQESTDVNVVQAQIDATEARLRRQIELLASARAWAHALSLTRLTGQSRSDLTQYAQLVRRLGKGTGKYAIARRAEIRDAMDRCRSSVPVWIMPIYRIAQQLRIHQNMFDVVIVDEASQAGLEATFLQYLAPKIVVIGDDKQVSPTAVGVDQQQLRDLADVYLRDDRYKASWLDPKRSLFDEANMRYGSKLTLVEHRRCVPEIIGFSNRIAYEPDNIRLLPVRQFGTERLDPIQVVHVTDGYEQGTTSKINRPEIDAIVSQLEKCLADPRYDGMSFGIISLQGKAQSSQIEAILLQRIPAQEWAARDLRCGDAADFQGSERDVVFLSMVAAPEPGQRLGSMTQEMYVQRYNVAGSRAKDQMWIFHSVTIEQLPNSEDMRHQLLDYCYGIRGRDDTAESIGPAPEDVRVDPFDSLFEQRVFNRLRERNYLVEAQFPASGYRIDLVVLGAKGRLAIECDGDTWHGPDAYERDLARQRELERCGWQFFRIRASEFYVDQYGVLQRLWATLDELEIRPTGWVVEELVDDQPQLDDAPVAAELVSEQHCLDDALIADGLVDDRSEVDDVATASNHASANTARAVFSEATSRLSSVIEASEAEHWTELPRIVHTNRLAVDHDALDHLGSAVPDAVEQSRLGAYAVETAALAEYRTFDGALVPALSADPDQLLDGLRRIVAVEGPVLGFRLHTAYVTASGGQRVGKQIARVLNGALSRALRTGDVIADNPLDLPGMKPRTYRLSTQSEVSVRELGPRTLEQVPPLELAHLLHESAVQEGWDSTESLFRTVLRRLGRGRLTTQAVETLTDVLPLAQSLDGGRTDV